MFSLLVYVELNSISLKKKENLTFKFHVKEKNIITRNPYDFVFAFFRFSFMERRGQKNYLYHDLFIRQVSLTI